MSYEKQELERILHVQRTAFLREGEVSAATRRSRVSRMALALLDNLEEIATSLSTDYGYRPPLLTKAFEGTAWVQDIQETLEKLEEWMAPEEVPGGFVQHKPKGVVGVIGAWNFPIILTFEPAMQALAAGNRVMLNFPEFHPKTGKLLEQIFSKAFPEDEVALIHGDLSTAQRFSELPFDHLFFTGSPKVGSLVSQAAARNLVPVTMELGGKNPVVVARDADMDLAATRIASTRLLNSGQICLCPDYAFVPREKLEEFTSLLSVKMSGFFPDYMHNPDVVSIVNDRNFERVTGLIDDAVSQGARKIVPLPAGESGRIADAQSRRVPPTLLLEVPETARIAHDEVFGPVLALYAYDDLQEVIDYVAGRPSPLAAYWYGEDSGDFRRFLACTSSGGASRNDGLVHAMLPGAPFGGIGNSGSGAYHGKAGFDTFTHRRTVANATQPRGVAEDLVGGALQDPAFAAGVQGAIEAAAAQFRGWL